MISVTTLNGYIYCKRKLFLEKVLGFFEPPKEALVKGHIRHQVYDEINKAEEQIVKGIWTGDFSEIFDYYKGVHSSILKNIIIKNESQLKNFDLNNDEVFYEFLPRILEESKDRAENVFNFIQKNRVFGEELWQKLTPKIKSEIKINSKKLNLVGVIDKLEVYENKIIPFELKTGSMPVEGVWPSHRVQLAAYCMLLEENYDTKINGGFVHYLDGKEKRKIILNPFLKAEIIQLIKEVENLLRQKEIPEMQENENKCKNCGLKESCFNERLISKHLKEMIN